MSIATTRFVTGADRFAALHTTALPQVDELWLFPGPPRTALARFDVDEEDVALKAGTTQSPSRYKGGLPKGGPAATPAAISRSLTRSDPARPRPDMVRAIDEIGAGVVTAIPVAGPFTVANTRAVLEIACSASSVARRTLHRALLGLASDGAQCWRTWRRATIRPARGRGTWALRDALGTIDGAAGTLVVVADTYRSLGTGRRLPAADRAVAAGLRRETFPGDGGIIAIVAIDEEASATRATRSTPGSSSGLGQRHRAGGA